MAEPTDEEDRITEQMETRLRGLAPKVVNLLADIIEGRKMLIVESSPDKAGNFVHSFGIVDNPATPPEAI